MKIQNQGVRRQIPFKMAPSDPHNDLILLDFQGSFEIKLSSVLGRKMNSDMSITKIANGKYQILFNKIYQLEGKEGGVCIS